MTFKCFRCGEIVNGAASASNHEWRHIVDEINGLPVKTRAALAKKWCRGCGFADGEHADDCEGDE